MFVINVVNAPGFLSDLLFLFQRLDLISFLDITLVAVIFRDLITVRDTQRSSSCAVSSSR